MEYRLRGMTKKLMDKDFASLLNSCIVKPLQPICKQIRWSLLLKDKREPTIANFTLFDSGSYVLRGRARILGYLYPSSSQGTTGETNLLYLRLASSKTLLPLSERMYKEHWETLLL